MNQAMYIGFGVLFAFVAVCFVILYLTWGISKIRKYKNQQLKDYGRNHPTKKHLAYDKTGMYVPSWQRAKYTSPIFAGVTFGIISVVFIVNAIIL
ncbi:hypothetical protein [Mycoplasmopsis sturni]|uniref:hypothetical protein n=1 Tax=Mycoplasmopsis sturni TaxID=39047 RepID=UPI00068FBBCF|nr:hypothetical protein [Mycoplasmopsis sturni]